MSARVSSVIGDLMDGRNEILLIVMARGIVLFHLAYITDAMIFVRIDGGYVISRERTLIVLIVL